MAVRKFLMHSCWALQHRIIPGLKNAQYSYYAILRELFPEGADWLDIGCGHAVFGNWMRPEAEELTRKAGRFTGVDIHPAGIRMHEWLDHGVIADAAALPFLAEAFDVVTANMVVEHLDRPDAVLAEVKRVLRPGGYFIFHTPNARNFKVKLAGCLPQGPKNRLIKLLENRSEEDVFETHYRLNTPASVREAATRCGLGVTGLHLVEDSPSTYMLGPLVIVELLIMRVLLTQRYRELRSNMIVVLRKPGPESGPREGNL